ncbi:MAG: hypothetical protein C4327_13365 [Meiothermus sp.]
MNPSASITDTIRNMWSQSVQVLTKPSVATFEQYEGKGGLREALVYVLLASIISGLFGPGGGVGGFLARVIGTIVGFLAFTYLVFYFGKNQGGTGSLDQVAYAFALFWAPLTVLFSVLTLLLIITLIGIFLVPLLGIVTLAANVYFAYLAVQSSLNLREGGKIWLTLLVAAVGTFLVNLIVGAIIR